MRRALVACSGKLERYLSAALPPDAKRQSAKGVPQRPQMLRLTTLFSRECIQMLYAPLPLIMRIRSVQLGTLVLVTPPSLLLRHWGWGVPCPPSVSRVSRLARASLGPRGRGFSLQLVYSYIVCRHGDISNTAVARTIHNDTLQLQPPHKCKAVLACTCLLRHSRHGDAVAVGGGKPVTGSPPPTLRFRAALRKVIFLVLSGPFALGRPRP